MNHISWIVVGAASVFIGIALFFIALYMIFRIYNFRKQEKFDKYCGTCGRELFCFYQSTLESGYSCTNCGKTFFIKEEA